MWIIGLYCMEDMAHFSTVISLTLKYNMWPDLQKPDTFVRFSNSCLLNIYNLLSQVYPLAKFQPHMPVTLGVTALQQKNQFVQQV